MIKFHRKHFTISLVIAGLSFGAYGQELYTHDQVAVYGGSNSYDKCTVDVIPNSTVESCKTALVSGNYYFGFRVKNGDLILQLSDELSFDRKDCVLFKEDPQQLGACNENAWWGTAKQATGFSRAVGLNPEMSLKKAARAILPYLRNEEWMSSVFGDDYDRSIAETLASDFEAGNIDWFPEIVRFDPANSSASIKGVVVKDSSTGQPAQLHGAYKNGTVYWSNEFVGHNIDGDPRIVAIQELAHHIDSLINPHGTHTGGEGVLAANLIYGKSALSNEEISKLQNYRDHFTIQIEGETIYGAELGFKEWAVGIMSAVAIVATAGIATPEVAAADAALLAGEVVVEEATAEGASVVTEEVLGALEVAGEAAVATEGVVPSFESLFGIAEFTGEVGSEAGALESGQIEAAHSALEEQGYRFVGYHGTLRNAAINIVNNGIGPVEGMAYPVGEPWSGFYFASEAEVAAGYGAGEPGSQLLRIYLPTAEANALQNIGAALSEGDVAISEIESYFGAGAWEANGNYLIRGIATAGESGTESIMGWGTASKAVAIPSSFQVGQDIYTTAEITLRTAWEGGASATPVGKPPLP